MAVAVGAWRSDPPLPDAAALGGYRPVRLFGRLPGVVIVSDFQRPPPELPIRYHEVIAAVLLRRGLRLAALPFAMWLDAPVPVELGHRHYSMPKQLDGQLRVELTSDALRVSGTASQLQGGVRAAWQRLLLWPVSWMVGLGVWAFTRWAPVIGVADQPPKRAQVALTPGGFGRPYALSRAWAGSTELGPLWCQGYLRCEMRLGAPRPAWPTEAA